MTAAGTAQPVTGVVLAGGRSRRFGSDKALVPVDGTALAARVAAALASCCAEVVVVGGDGPALAALGLSTLPDEVPGLGPLGGLVSALGAAGHDWCFVAACDMPGIDGPFVRHVATRALAAAAGIDAVVPHHADGRAEPLLACYHRRAGETARELLHRGERAMKALLGTLRVEPLPESELAASGFDLARVARNVNRPQDLRRATRD